jgi:hypothetical protein
MKNRTSLLIVVSICVILLVTFFSGINSQKSAKQETTNIKINLPSIPDSLFKSGDLIFRDGRGFISNAFRKLSRTDPRYSHAGIIHRENEKIFVYHLIGGEENKNSRMRKDLLADFCNPFQANSFGVYRSDLDGSKVDSLATNLYHKGIIFDADFDLSTDDKMYCTELVFKILTKVSAKENYLPLTVLSGIKYEACDNIYLSPHSKKIYSLNYAFTNEKK